VNIRNEGQNRIDCQVRITYTYLIGTRTQTESTQRAVSVSPGGTSSTSVEGSALNYFTGGLTTGVGGSFIVDGSYTINCVQSSAARDPGRPTQPPPRQNANPRNAPPQGNAPTTGRPEAPTQPPPRQNANPRNAPPQGNAPTTGRREAAPQGAQSCAELSRAYFAESRDLTARHRGVSTIPSICALARDMIEFHSRWRSRAGHCEFFDRSFSDFMIQSNRTTLAQLRC
jgi:hypothetical protein